MLSNLSSKNNSLIEVHSVFLHLFSKAITFDHVTLVNLYTFNYREATGAMFIHASTKVAMDFLFQTFCNNKIQQILQEKQMPTR